MEKSEITIYQTKYGKEKIDVQLTKDTVWLNRSQKVMLFDRDIKTIGKHIPNALKEELRNIPTVANLRQFKMKGTGRLNEN